MNGQAERPDKELTEVVEDETQAEEGEQQEEGVAEIDDPEAALQAAEAKASENWERYLKPLIRYLKKRGALTPLSELGDEFAHTQVYPWHLKTACEWLADQGILERVSMPITLTKKSRVEIEEPAYELTDQGR